MNTPISDSVYHDEYRGPNKEERILWMLAYTPGGFILPYLLGLSGRVFPRFHVKQGFVFFALYVVAVVLPIPGVATFAALPYLLVSLWHGYQAYQGKLYGFGWMAFVHQWDDPLEDAAKLVPPAWDASTEQPADQTPPKN